MRAVLALCLVLSTFCFALGVTLPLLRVKRLLFLVDEPSLLLIIRSLWQSSDWALAVVVALFSVVFPCVKLIYLHLAALDAAPARLHGALRVLANWSMLDVVLVAIVIFAAKTSGLATAFTLPGLWFFTGSAVLTALASALVARKSGRPARRAR